MHNDHLVEKTASIQPRMSPPKFVQMVVRLTLPGPAARRVRRARSCLRQRLLSKTCCELFGARPDLSACGKATCHFFKQYDIVCCCLCLLVHDKQLQKKCSPILTGLLLAVTEIFKGTLLDELCVSSIPRGNAKNASLFASPSFALLVCREQLGKPAQLLLFKTPAGLLRRRRNI